MAKVGRALSAALMLLAGCTVHLTPGYDADVAKEVSDLQEDFFVFAGTMQVEAGTPAGYYSNHEKDYVDFEARLASIRFQTENDAGGLPCGKTLQAIQKANAAALDKLDPSIKAQLLAFQGSDTCMTILAKLAEQQMELLRKIHADSCKPVLVGNVAKPDPHCPGVFGDPPLFDVIGTTASTAPAVSAVSIVLNELVRQEQLLKPLETS